MSAWKIEWRDHHGCERIEYGQDVRIYKMLDGGDHWIVLGEVTALHSEPDADDPLVFFRGSYRRLEDKDD